MPVTHRDTVSNKICRSKSGDCPFLMLEKSGLYFCDKYKVVLFAGTTKTDPEPCQACTDEV